MQHGPTTANPTPSLDHLFDVTIRAAWHRTIGTDFGFNGYRRLSTGTLLSRTRISTACR
jgi:hypothetical protein